MNNDTQAAQSDAATNQEKDSKPADGRMKKILKIMLYGGSALIVFLFVLDIMWVGSGSNEWKLEMEKNGVKVYSLKTPGTSKKMFRSSMQMDYHSLSQLVAGQIENANMETCKELVLGCMDLQVVHPFDPKEMSDTMLWKIKLPGPFLPRENLIKSQIYQDKKTKAVTIEIMAAPNEIPRNLGAIRTTNIHNIWEFTPLETGRVQIDYFLDMGLGGMFPDHLMNVGAVNTMYTWIHDLFPKLVDRKQFRTIQYDFIEEPENKKREVAAIRQ